MAASTSFTSKSLSTLATEQAGYTFSQWKSSMTCTVIDNNRVANIVATIVSGVPVIKTYITTTATADNYRGTWENSPFVVQGVTQQIYKDPTVTYSPVTATASNGGYVFSITINSKTRNIALFPNGFYLGRSTLYVPGC